MTAMHKATDNASELLKSWKQSLVSQLGNGSLGRILISREEGPEQEEVI